MRMESARALLTEFAAFAGTRRLAQAAALILAGVTLEGVGILLIVPLLAPLLDQGVAPGGVAGGPLGWLLQSAGQADPIVVLVVGFAGLLALRSAVLVAREVTIARLQHGYVESIKLGLLEHLAQASWGEVMAIDRARLVKALGGDMVQIAHAVHYAVQAVVGIVVLVVLAGFAALLSPELSLMALVLVVAVGLTGALSIRRATMLGAGHFHNDMRMSESSARFLTGLKLAKAQDLQQAFIETYADASNGLIRNRLAFVRQVASSRQLIALLGALAAVGVMIVGALLTEASMATMIAFFVLLSRTTAPAALVVQSVQQIAHSLPIFDELRSLHAALGRNCATTPACEPSAVPAPRGTIALQSISLSFPATAGEAGAGLDDLSLIIGPGEFVGISGPSGAGKSTLLDVIALIAAPDSGRIALGSVAGEAVDPGEHRRRLAYLSADPALFADTVRTNLAWADPAAGDEAIWSALRKAGAEGLVQRLGHGLDSLIGEAGSNLSAGERQRIACARAFLRRPELWLLDEATCSLDLAGEQRLIGQILAEPPRPTVLFVTHRAESLACCDRVVTLAAGRLVGDDAARPAGVERLRA